MLNRSIYEPYVLETTWHEARNDIIPMAKRFHLSQITRANPTSSHIGTSASILCWKRPRSTTQTMVCLRFAVSGVSVFLSFQDCEGNISDCHLPVCEHERFKA